MLAVAEEVKGPSLADWVAPQMESRWAPTRRDKFLGKSFDEDYPAAPLRGRRRGSHQSAEAHVSHLRSDNLEQEWSVWCQVGVQCYAVDPETRNRDRSELAK